MQLVDEIRINRVVRGMEPLPQFLATFDEATEERRRDLVRGTIRMAEQAGPRDADVPDAIAKSGVNPRRTSAVVIGLPLRQNVWRLASLPNGDLGDAMRLVLALFAIADDRRRTTRCARGCSHWWHGELSDVDAVLAALAPGVGPSHE